MSKFFTAEDIVLAFRQTKLQPIRYTWARVTLHAGFLVPCGCALVALAEAAGCFPAMQANEPFGAATYAHALGISRPHAQGILDGWDSPHRRPSGNAPSGPVYYAGWQAANTASRTLFGEEAA